MDMVTAGASTRKYKSISGEEHVYEYYVPTLRHYLQARRMAKALGLNANDPLEGNLCLAIVCISKVDGVALHNDPDRGIMDETFYGAGGVRFVDLDDMFSDFIEMSRGRSDAAKKDYPRS